jgi:hypothetical protein
VTASGTDIGSITALFVTPVLTSIFGWQSAPYILAVIASGWIFVFSMEGASSPNLDPKIDPAELELISKRYVSFDESEKVS